MDILFHFHSEYILSGNEIFGFVVLQICSITNYYKSVCIYGGITSTFVLFKIKNITSAPMPAKAATPANVVEIMDIIFDVHHSPCLQWSNVYMLQIFETHNKSTAMLIRI